jgi:hypothetical protein
VWALSTLSTWVGYKPRLEGLAQGFVNIEPSPRPVKAATKARPGSGFWGSAAGARMALGRALHITKSKRDPSHASNGKG